MEDLFSTVVLALLALMSCSSNTQDQAVLQNNQYLRAMSFNIRYDNPNDGINKWSNRIPLISSYLAQTNPDILGMQEVQYNQLQDLTEILEDYSYISRGRDDGALQGEAGPIFFRKNMFTLRESGHFWLSETPDVPGSMSWNTENPRIATWVKLTTESTGQPLFVFNTHFSHVSDLARRKSASYLLEQIKAIAGQSPVMLMGDFNTPPDSVPYITLVSADENGPFLQDAEHLADSRQGGDSSFNAFDPEFAGKRIDFIFVSEHFDVHHHSVDEIRDNGIYISDHYPVWIEVEIK